MNTSARTPARSLALLMVLLTLTFGVSGCLRLGKTEYILLKPETTGYTTREVKVPMLVPDGKGGLIEAEGTVKEGAAVRYSTDEWQAIKKQWSEQDKGNRLDKTEGPKHREWRESYGATADGEEPRYEE